MGRPLSQCMISVQSSGPASGIAIEMLAGGSVYQRSPAHRRAPLSLEPEDLTLEFQADSEDSWHAWRAAKALSHAQPVEFFFGWPIEDTWSILDGATSWQLSRTLPFGLVSPATFAPRAFLCDVQGPAEEEMTLVTSGTPGAGELKFDPAANSISVETADLSAEVGRLLVFRYYPLRLVRVESLEQDYSRENDLVYTAELAEVVPERDYS